VAQRPGRIEDAVRGKGEADGEFGVGVAGETDDADGAWLRGGAGRVGESQWIEGLGEGSRDVGR